MSSSGIPAATAANKFRAELTPANPPTDQQLAKYSVGLWPCGGVIRKRIMNGPKEMAEEELYNEGEISASPMKFYGGLPHGKTIWVEPCTRPEAYVVGPRKSMYDSNPANITWPAESHLNRSRNPLRSTSAGR
jgi:hypothetical protein